jgi:hypothetical protein
MPAPYAVLDAQPGDRRLPVAVEVGSERGAPAATAYQLGASTSELAAAGRAFRSVSPSVEHCPAIGTEQAGPAGGVSPFVFPLGGGDAFVVGRGGAPGSARVLGRAAVYRIRFTP